MKKLKRINLEDLLDKADKSHKEANPLNGYSQAEPNALFPNNKVFKKKRMAIGGVVADPTALVNGAKPIIDGILSLIEGTPDYSSQPIVNASTMRNMASPYSFAMGGTVDDLDEEQLAALQEYARQTETTPEEAYEQWMEEQEGEDEPIEEEEELLDEDEELFEPEPEEDDEEGFFAMGGQAGLVGIEVEDDEVMEFPDGTIAQVDGKTHEKGGEDVDVPQGTNIYSDRLAIGGKTMQERKLDRERFIARIKKSASPGSLPSKNTLKRTTQIQEVEEQQDMAIQKAVGSMLNKKRLKFAGGGKVPLIAPMLPEGYEEMGFLNTSSLFPTVSNTPKIDTSYGIATAPTNINQPITTAGVSSNPVAPVVKDGTTQGLGMGVGDMIGLAGNAFNAIAPIINTMNARKATRPNINRFKGFGKDGLDANQAAMSHVDTIRGNAIVDINTSANSASARNRNGARSVNTVRALDIASDANNNKAKTGVRSAYAGQMAKILGMRSQLENQQDMMEMRGQTETDAENQADIDNHYSNMAQNLTNFGSNIQGIGRNLGTVQSNNDDMDLLGLLSENGIKLGRKNGKLTIVNNK